MAKDILIDLGTQWGHILPLSAMENIVHIEVTESNHMSFDYETTVLGDDPGKDQTYRSRTYTSRQSFTDDEIIVEKARLLGMSNGLISKDDAKTIFESIESQTGGAIHELLAEPIYDISFIRRVWCAQMGVPFLRFIIQYDPLEDEFLMDEEHNDDFKDVVLRWLDGETVRQLSLDDQILVLINDAIFRMAEPILPEDVLGNFTDPGKDVPVMGSVGSHVAQEVDLSTITPDQIMVKST